MKIGLRSAPPPGPRTDAGLSCAQQLELSNLQLKRCVDALTEIGTEEARRTLLQIGQMEQNARERGERA